MWGQVEHGDLGTPCWLGRWPPLEGNAVVHLFYFVNRGLLT